MHRTITDYKCYNQNLLRNLIETFLFLLYSCRCWGRITTLVGKKGDQSDRITVMIDADIFSKLQLDLAKEIKECAQTGDGDYSPSFSRIINRCLQDAFDSGLDKKVLKNLFQLSLT